jgi:hypothetical protein
VTRKNTKNFEQGQAVAERETARGWGGPDTAASPLPVDQHYTRRGYMGYGQLPPDTRRQPALAGDELARIVTNVSPAQLIHGATTRPRGMPGKETYPGGGPTGHIKAVHRFGLGPLVRRPADEGHDPGIDAVNADYLHNPRGPRPDVLDKYVGAASLLPAPTGYGSGYPQLPRYHQLSAMPVMGDDLYRPFDPPEES